jgi:hypothetical protein
VCKACAGCICIMCRVVSDFSGFWSGVAESFLLRPYVGSLDNLTF